MSMTMEQAIEILKIDLAIQKEFKALPDHIEALEMAIKFIEQEPCDKDINVSTRDAIEPTRFEFDEEQEQLDFVQPHNKIPVTIKQQEPYRDIEEINEIMECDADAETKCKMISSILTAKSHYFEKQEPCEMTNSDEIKGIIIKSLESADNYLISDVYNQIVSCCDCPYWHDCLNEHECEVYIFNKLEDKNDCKRTYC